jgi:glycine cleavage system protein P-like pyridoxal-binding family
MLQTNSENVAGAVASAPFGSALVLSISYGYIKMS